MSASWIDNLVEGVGFLTEVILLFVVLRKSHWRTLPVFTVLAFYAPLEDLILVLTSRLVNTQTYLRAFWGFAIVDYSLQLALVWEIARSVLRPSTGWIPGVRQRFAFTSLLSAMLALYISVSMVKPAIPPSELIYRRVSLFTSLLTCICFLNLSYIANRLGLPRKDHTRAIGQGLAVWNVACLVADAARNTTMSANVVSALDYVSMGLWDAVLVYWAGALWLQERSHTDLALSRVPLLMYTPDSVKAKEGL